MLDREALRFALTDELHPADFVCGLTEYVGLIRTGETARQCRGSHIVAFCGVLMAAILSSPLVLPAP